MSHFFENGSKVFSQNSNHLNMKNLNRDGKLLQNELPRIVPQKHKSVGWKVIV